MNKVLKILAFIILIAALGVGGYYLFFQKEVKEETEVIKAEKKDASKKKKKEASIPVKVLAIKRGNLPLRLNISATAEVWEKSTIRAEVAGTIESLDVKVGGKLRRNQILVKIDDEEYQLSVERAKAEKLRALSNYLVKDDTSLLGDQSLTDEQKKELETLKGKYQQALKDFEKRKITRKEFDKISENYQKLLIFSGDMRDEVRKATEGLSAAVASLKQAEFNLRKCKIRSPFNGIVAEILISKGEKVAAGAELCRVVNLNTLYLKGFALESELPHLKKGTKVRIRFDSYPDQYFYGELQAISPEIDQETKTITVYVKVDNKDNLFLPGMHAEIDLEYKVFENVIKVPRNAVLIRQDRPLVFKVKDKIALWEYVQIGNQNDEEIEIKSGINEGDLVVIDGHLTLAHQSRVKIIK